MKPLLQLSLYDTILNPKQRGWPYQTICYYNCNKFISLILVILLHTLLTVLKV